MEPPPPPQDVTRIIAKHAQAKITSFVVLRLPSNSNTGKLKTTTATVLIRIRSVDTGSRAALERAVVLTVAWKLMGVELRFSELGTLQVAAGGAPEQVRVTVPLDPG